MDGAAVRPLARNLELVAAGLQLDAVLHSVLIGITRLCEILKQWILALGRYG